MIYNRYVLPNGLRMIHLPTTSDVAYCGYAINGGTRDEHPSESGMAHFIEHMLFKGTTHRRAGHIVNRMEHVGGELNAYTAKEETVLYSLFLEEHTPRAIDLLSDLVLHSNFPLNELEKEREVVLDEINSYRDNPAELIYDEFENHLFASHALGCPILGNPQSLATFTPELSARFLQEQYNAQNMVFFYMGRTPATKVLRLLERSTQELSLRADFRNERVAPNPITPFHRVESHDTYQNHVLLGGRAYSMFDTKRTTLFLLNNILGGPGMNSRLNLALRERSGYVYNVESALTTYTDTGVFSIYFGTDPKNRTKCIALVEKILRELCQKSLTTLQLHHAKKQLIGQMGVGMENRENIALGMGKSFLHFDRYDTPQESYQRIEAITASDLLAVANEVIDPTQLSTLIFE